MAQNRRTSRSDPAQPHWEYHGRLRACLLGRFDSDSRFAAALLGFYGEHREYFEANPDGDWLALVENAHRDALFGEESEAVRHHKAVIEFATSFHLDVLGEYAVATVHDWCVRHHQYGEGWSPLMFSICSPGFGGLSVPIPITLHIDTSWNVESETYEAVVKRIDALYKTERQAVLNRIMNEGSYVFASAQQSETKKHLGWLFERIAHEKSCFTISIDDGDPDADASDAVTESGVRKVTDRLARRMGIDPSAIPTPKSDT